MRTTMLLRHRNFGLLWLAGYISMAGDWALGVSLSIYVFQLTGSPAATSAVVAARVVTGLLVGSVSGVYVDRWDRRRVLIVANLLQAAAVAPLVLVGSAGTVWIVYPVIAAQAALAQFVEPAEHALLPGLVPAQQRTAANALNALNNNLARLTGPAIGGGLAAATGLAGAAVFDAVTFAAAAVLVTLIRGGYRAVPSVDAEPMIDAATRPAGTAMARLREDLATGLRAVARSRLLRGLFVVLTVTSVGEGVMGALFPVFVSRALHGAGAEIGTLMSAQAVGGIVGGLLAAALGRHISPARMLAGALVLFGAVDVAIFNLPRWSPDMLPQVALFILVGLPAAALGAAAMTLLQSEVPDGLRGRVFAAAMVTESAATLIGAGLAATLTERFGVIPVLTAQGVAPIVAAAVFVLMARRRPARRTADRAEFSQGVVPRPLPERTPAWLARPQRVTDGATAVADLAR